MDEDATPHSARPRGNPEMLNPNPHCAWINQWGLPASIIPRINAEIGEEIEFRGTKPIPLRGTAGHGAQLEIGGA